MSESGFISLFQVVACASRGGELALSLEEFIGESNSWLVHVLGFVF